jgi:hypothetical protein
MEVCLTLDILLQRFTAIMYHAIQVGGEFRPG